MSTTTDRRTPVAGDRAPEVTIPDDTGTPRQLSEFWSTSEHGCVVVFLRHFGCIFCREHAIQLRRDYDAFVSRGYAVVAIGDGTPARAALFRKDLDLRFPILADREHRGYDAYGLGKTKMADLVNPKLFVAGLRALSSGAMQGKSSGDARQLPGTFIVDPAGIVRYAHPATIASDLASTTELIAWIEQNRGPRS
jgi:peroxiredoxin